MIPVLVIDNYDSFTFNLVHYLEALNCKVTVFRNDQFDIDEIHPFKKIIISPGSGIPSEAGKIKEVIATFYKTKSILGICLGHQAICEVFNGSLKNLEKPFHGVATQINIIDQNEHLFKNIPNEISVGRYHSWVANNENFPAELQITSVDAFNNIMSFSHKVYDVKAVQFHPESILTQYGKEILSNWLQI